MEQEKLRNALKTISIWEGIPEETILTEIEASIALGYQRVIKEGDPRKIAIWNEISPNRMPTVYEFVSYIASLLPNVVI